MFITWCTVQSVSSAYIYINNKFHKWVFVKQSLTSEEEYELQAYETKALRQTHMQYMYKI
jgi:hypothetical protein